MDDDVIRKLKEYATGDYPPSVQMAAQTKLEQKLAEQQKAQVAEFASNPLKAGITGLWQGGRRVLQDVASAPLWVGDKLGVDTGFDEYRAGIKQQRADIEPYIQGSKTAQAGQLLGELAATAPAGLVGKLPAVASAGRLGKAAAYTGANAAGGAAGADNPMLGAIIGAAGTPIADAAGATIRGAKSKLLPAEAPPSSLAGVDILPENIWARETPGKAAMVAETLPVGGGMVRSARLRQAGQLDDALAGIEARYADAPDVSALPGSLRDTMLARKQRAGELYDEVERAMPPVPLTAADQPWRAEAERILAAQQARPAGRQDQQLVSAMKGYLDEPVDTTWGALRDLRSDVGADLRGMYSGSSQIGPKAAPSISRVKGALEADMASLATNEADDLWQAADRFYATDVAGVYGKESKSIVKGLMNKGTPEEVATTILKPSTAGNQSQVRAVYDGLTDPGRDAVRKQIIGEAFSAGRTAEGFVSPASISTYIERRMPLFKQFLPGEDVEALSRTLRSLEQVGSAGKAPPTGWRGAIAGGTQVPVALGGIAGGTSEGDATDRLVAGAGVAGTTLGVTAALGALAGSLATGDTRAVRRALNGLSAMTKGGGRVATNLIAHSVGEEPLPPTTERSLLLP